SRRTRRGRSRRGQSPSPRTPSPSRRPRRSRSSSLDTVIAPFRIEIPDAQLDDLHDRLDRTRWPEKETVDDWSQGIPLSYVQELCGHWRASYDWRATEARLNEIPQFRTELEGLNIHFLHVRSDHEDALPLILTHG